MASVQELKDALIDGNSKAIELADRSIGAMETLLALSGFVLTVLGLIVAILAVLGYTFLEIRARSAAKSVANKTLDAYLKSKEFRSIIDTGVEEGVKERMNGAFIVNNITREPDDNPNDPFPPAEEANK